MRVSVRAVIGLCVFCTIIANVWFVSQFENFEVNYSPQRSGGEAIEAATAFAKVVDEANRAEAAANRAEAAAAKAKTEGTAAAAAKAKAETDAKAAAAAFAKVVDEAKRERVAWDQQSLLERRDVANEAAAAFAKVVDEAKRAEAAAAAKAKTEGTAAAAAKAKAETDEKAATIKIVDWDQQSLLERLQCKTAAEQPFIENKVIVNFFASAVGEKYEEIIPMYAFYALSSHRSIGRAFVEIVVTDPNKFIERHNTSLAWLLETFSSYNDTIGACCVRNYTHDHSIRTENVNTWRYLEVPYQPAKYTYVGDIDIFLTESVLDKRRMQQMETFRLPYSNIIRNYNTSERRLTGLMLLETERFYTPALIKAQANLDAKGNDEMFLYNLVVESGIGIPSPNEPERLVKYRPLHGLHLSLSRGPNKKMCLTNGLESIDSMLSVDMLEAYLRHDQFADRFLSSVKAKIETETKKKMKEVNGTCQ